MTDITRRHLLALGAGAAFALHPLAAFARKARTALPIPPLLEPDAAGRIPLEVAKGRHAFAPGGDAASAGVNGAYLGPTVRLATGRSVTLSVANRMEEETTLHWHGLFVPSDLDGGPHNVIAPGGRWEPEVTVDQPASLNWFHPHLHGATARQTHMGLAGLMIVDDGKDGARGLPQAYGVDDLPLVLQDRRALTGDAVYRPDRMDLMHGFLGDRLIVNGVVAPEARVPAAVVRLRLLNGANARNFHLRFSDRRPMHVIASDGGYITTPESLRRLTIAPGERYEVLVDFSAGGGSVGLLTGQDDGGADLPLMRFAVDAKLPGAVRALPKALDGPAAPEPSLAVRRRAFVFDERMAENMKHMDMEMHMSDPHAAHMHHGRGMAAAGPALDTATSGVRMAIAGEPFDMKRIDVEARLGSWEIWTLETQEMPHPFHIHGASFRILTLNGRTPPPHRAGWKDTALIDGKAELLIHFNRAASRERPFMFHCHVLEHEDVGMMAQFVTV